MKKFKCISCGLKYPWILEGGNHKMIKWDFITHKDDKKTCAYCAGIFADRTACNGGKTTKAFVMASVQPTLYMWDH